MKIRYLLILTLLLAILAVPASAVTFTEDFEECTTSPSLITASPMSWTSVYGSIYVSDDSALATESGWAVDGDRCTSTYNEAYKTFAATTSGHSYVLSFSAYAAAGETVNCGVGLGVDNNNPYNLCLWASSSGGDHWRFDARGFLDDNDATDDFYTGGFDQVVQCQVVIDTARHVVYAMVLDNLANIHKSKEFMFTAGTEAGLQRVTIEEYQPGGYECLDVDNITFDEIVANPMAESFDECEGVWSADDWISVSPVSWVAVDGNIKVSESSAFGASTWAIDGSQSSSTWNSAYKSISPLVLRETYALNFRAYATTGTASSGISIGDADYPDATGLWVVNGTTWRFDARVLADDSCAVDDFYTGGIGEIVKGQVVIDQERRITYGVIMDSFGNTHKSRQFPIEPGRDSKLSNVMITEYKGGSYTDGLDLDDIVITHIPRQLFMEDFRECNGVWSSADSIATFPASWTVEIGDLVLSKTSHLGSGDWAVDGSLTPGAYNQAYKSITPPLLGETISMYLNAWATESTGMSGISFGVDENDPYSAGIWCVGGDTWRFDARGLTDNQSSYDDFYTGSIGEKVTPQIVVDAIRHVAYAYITDKDAVVHKSDEFSFDPGREAELSRITIYEYTPTGWDGLDINAINIERRSSKHTIKQSDGDGGWTYSTGDSQLLKFIHPEYYGLMPFGLMQMDNDEIALVCAYHDPAFGGGYPDHYVLYFSPDNGVSWSPKVYAGAGRAVAYAYLGSGDLTIKGAHRSFSTDYGRTWPQPLLSDDPPSHHNELFYNEGQPLVDYDAYGDATAIAEFGSDTGGLGSSWVWGVDQCHGMIRWSTNDGYTWGTELEPSAWDFQYTYDGDTYNRGCSEGALFRMANGRIIAGLRTDPHPRIYVPNGPPGSDGYDGLGASYSTDDGVTWSTIDILYETGRNHPKLVQKPDGGDVVMSYVKRYDITDGQAAEASDYRGLDALVSADGANWDTSEYYVLDEFRGTPAPDAVLCGHTASLALSDGSILSAYGHYPSDGVVIVRWTPDVAGQ